MGLAHLFVTVVLIRSSDRLLTSVSAGTIVVGYQSWHFRAFIVVTAIALYFVGNRVLGREDARCAQRIELAEISESHRALPARTMPGVTELFVFLLLVLSIAASSHAVFSRQKVVFASCGRGPRRAWRPSRSTRSRIGSRSDAAT